jgi:hypothetical protein
LIEKKYVERYLERDVETDIETDKEGIRKQTKLPYFSFLYASLQAASLFPFTYC